MDHQYNHLNDLVAKRKESINGLIRGSFGTYPIVNVQPAPITISFKVQDGLEIIKLEANGDIYVKGRLIENDKELVYGMREFLIAHGYGHGG